MATLAVLGSSGWMAAMIRQSLPKMITARHRPGLRPSTTRFGTLNLYILTFKKKTNIPKTKMKIHSTSTFQDEQTQKKKLKGKNSIFKKFRCTYWTPFTGRPGGTRIRIAMNCVLWPFGRNASVRVLEEFVVANNLSPFVSGAAGFRALRTSIKPSSVLMR